MPHGEASRFEVKASEVEFSSKCALAMALARHELTTNAVNYGALRDQAGRIFVSWWLHEGHSISAGWRSTAAGDPPTKVGFESRMIKKALAGYLAGRRTFITSHIAWCSHWERPSRH